MPKVDKKARAVEEEGVDASEESTTMITAATRSATKRAASGSYTQKTLTSMFSKSKTTKAKASASGKGKEVATVVETVAQADL